MIPIIQPDRQASETKRRRDEGLASALGQAFSGGVSGYLQGRRESQQQERTARQLAADKILKIQMQGIPIAQEELPQVQQEAYQEALTGQQGPTLSRVLNEGFQAKILADQERMAQERAIRNQQQQKGAIDLAEAQRQQKELGLPFEQTREGQKLAYGNKLAIEKEAAKQSLKKSSTPGFEVDPGVSLTKQDDKLLKDANQVTKNIVGSAKNLISSINKYGITSGADLTEGSRKVSQNVKDLQIQMKELFNLGVLNGPDLDILNQALGRVQGPIDMLNPLNSKEDAIAQVESVIKSAESRLDSAAQSRGARYIGERYTGFKQDSKSKEKFFNDANASSPTFTDDEIMKELKRRGFR